MRCLAVFLICWSAVAPTRGSDLEQTADSNRHRTLSESGPVDFDTEVVPILSKVGCNAAACHGGAAGQAGFRLSLFGGDPDFDHRTIVRELEGRRVNLHSPRDSLLLLKPGGHLEHGGEDCLDYEGPESNLIAAWIDQGAKRRRLRKLTRLVISPTEFEATDLPVDFRISVTAVFDDGLQRDVTSTAIYSTSDESSVHISANGTTAVTRLGRHTILVRFGQAIEPLTVTIPIGKEPIEVAALARRNWIDDSINETLRKLRIPLSPQADDATFLRRVHLDLIGRLPDADRISPFVHDTSEGKRERLIDELIASDEFTEFWTFRLAELLRIRPIGADLAAAEAMHQWLATKVASGASWNEMVVELMCAEGDSHVNGAATVHRLATTAREQAEYVSEVMMGVRLKCANCHNHPLDKWTQDDYHGLAQIFSRIDRRQQVRVMDRGEVTNPRTGQAAIPYLPGGIAVDVTDDARKQLATWLTENDNPYLARAMVGRLWKALMGRSLTEPVDDLRSTNPPTHPELLDALATTFAEEHNFDIRKMIRLICGSAAYARSSQPTDGNESDDRFYSHAIAKPLGAEVLADAIADATGVFESYGDLPIGTRAISLVSPATANSESLNVLGVCGRVDACTNSPSGDRGLATKLHLLNGPLLNTRITSPDGRLAKLIHSKQSNEQIVEQLYLHTLNREPTAAEQVHWRNVLEQTESVPAPETDSNSVRQLQDLFWSLLSCREFLTNH